MGEEEIRRLSFHHTALLAGFWAKISEFSNLSWHPIWMLSLELFNELSLIDIFMTMFSYSKWNEFLIFFIDIWINIKISKQFSGSLHWIMQQSKILKQIYQKSSTIAMIFFTHSKLLDFLTALLYLIAFWYFLNNIF